MCQTPVTHWAFRNDNFEEEQHQGTAEDCAQCSGSETTPITHFGMSDSIWEEHKGREEDCPICQEGDHVSAYDFVPSALNAGAALASGEAVDLTMAPANLRALACRE